MPFFYLHDTLDMVRHWKPVYENFTSVSSGNGGSGITSSDMESLASKLESPNLQPPSGIGSDLSHLTSEVSSISNKIAQDESTIRGETQAKPVAKQKITKDIAYMKAHPTPKPTPFHPNKHSPGNSGKKHPGIPSFHHSSSSAEEGHGTVSPHHSSSSAEERHGTVSPHHSASSTEERHATVSPHHSASTTNRPTGSLTKSPTKSPTGHPSSEKVVESFASNRRGSAGQQHLYQEKLEDKIAQEKNIQTYTDHIKTAQKDLSNLRSQLITAEAKEARARGAQANYRRLMQLYGQQINKNTHNLTDSIQNYDKNICDGLDQEQNQMYINQTAKNIPNIKSGLAAACAGKIVNTKLTSYDKSSQDSLFEKDISNTQTSDYSLYAACPRDQNGHYIFDANRPQTYRCTGESGPQGHVEVTHAKMPDTQNRNYDSMQCTYSSDDCVLDSTKTAGLGDIGLLSEDGNTLVNYNYKSGSSHSTKSPRIKDYEQSIEKQIQTHPTVSPSRKKINKSGASTDCGGFEPNLPISTLSPKEAPFHKADNSALRYTKCQKDEKAALSFKTHHPFLVVNANDPNEKPYLMKDGYLYNNQASLSDPSFQGEVNTKLINKLGDAITSESPPKHRNFCRGYPIGYQKDGFVCCLPPGDSGVGASWQKADKCPGPQNKITLPMVNVHEDCFHSVPVVDNWLRTYTKKGNLVSKDNVAIDFKNSYDSKDNEFVFEKQRGTDPTTFANKNLEQCKKYKNKFDNMAKTFAQDTQHAASNYREIAKTNALIDNQNLTHNKNRNSVHNITNSVQNDQRQVQIANDESFRRNQNLFLLRLLLFYVILIIILFLIKRAVGNEKFTNNLLIILLVAISLPFIYILGRNLYSIRNRSNNRWSLRNFAVDYSKMPGFPRDGRGGSGGSGGSGSGGGGGGGGDDDSGDYNKAQDDFEHLSKKEQEKLCKSTLSPQDIKNLRSQDKRLRQEINNDKKQINHLKQQTKQKMKQLEKEMKKTNQELCDVDHRLESGGVKNKKCLDDKEFNFDFNINV